MAQRKLEGDQAVVLLPGMKQQQDERVREKLPLSGYATLMGIYLTAMGGFIAYAKKRKGKLPKQMPLSDILLIGITAHKLGRVITEERVARPIRAPFVEYEGSGEPGTEIREKVPRSGFKRAVGELVTCPWCMAPWVAGSLTALWLFNPRAARIVAGIGTAFALADWLNVCYYKVEKGE